jgi:membrane fusion protein, multidrug efflux system
MPVDLLSSQQHAAARRPGWVGGAARAASLVAALACAKLGAPPRSADPEVPVATVQPAPASIVREVPARTAPFRTAEVRGRVSGIVQKRLFAEGAEVKEGQLLFRIDPALYEAAYDSARARLAQAEARAAAARLLARRGPDAASSDEAARQDGEDATAARSEAEADLEAARAAVEAACINLGYTAVTSSIAGRIGRAAVAEGGYAQRGQATLLATVEQLDPMFVEATLSSAEAARLRADLAAGRLPRTETGAVRVTLVLENGREYREPGTVQLSDVAVDPATDAITVRAVFPNPRRELVPGAAVRARLEEVVDAAAVLVPESAVRREARGRGTAFVVDASNRVEARPVELRHGAGDDWLVTAGLRAGERVVLDDLHKVRSGMTVRPVRALDVAAKR